jgi:amino acid transporter
VADASFSRKASGLVRSWSPVDMWIYNVLAMNPVIMAAITFTLMLVTYPQASLPLAAVVAGLFCTAQAIVYAVVVSAMPRSGGDYVIQSRVFGGAVGSLFGFSAVTIGGMIWMALAGWTGAVLIMSPFATLLGAQYHASWLVSLGEWFQEPLGIFVVGFVVIAWGALVNIRGLRFYAVLQRWFFWLGALLLGVVLIVFLLTDHQTFVNNLNGFMSSNYHVHNAYDKVIAAGGSANFSFSFHDTVLAAVIAAFSLIYPAWSVQQAGEIRRAGSLRANLIGIVGAEVFAFILVALISALLVSRVGSHFLYSSGVLYYEGSTKSLLPVAPFFGFFIGLMSTSPILTWLALLMFLAWFWMWFPNITLGGTRVMMAMAFDRVLPEPVGKIDRRSHAPVIAIAAFSVGCLAILAMYAFIPTFFKLTLGLTLLNITAFGVSVAAGGLFPWLKRDLYETSEARRWAIGKLPLVTVVAAIFVAFAVWVDYQSLFANELGLNGTPGLIYIGGTYLVSLAVYLGARIYRRRADGLDLNTVYKSLPTE